MYLPVLLVRSRAALTACLLLTVLGVAACAKQQCSASASAPSASLRTDFGKFTVSATDAAAGAGLLIPALGYAGKDITPGTDPLRAITPGPEAEAFPLPGCRSRTVELFTGGANCCFGYYILTTCPDVDHAAYVEPGNSGIGQPDQALRAYPTTDAAFFYYQPAGQAEKTPFFLNRAESPRISRFLVFDAGTWRADKPGELPATYEALLADIAAKGPVNPVARAILLTYYSLMAGKDTPTATQTLRTALPKEYKYLLPTVFADITTAIAGFSPITTIPLGR